MGAYIALLKWQFTSQSASHKSIHSIEKYYENLYT